MSDVERAFEVIDRRQFVPLEYQDSAYVDIPLPIGYGQTISQPSTVRQMLEWLDVRPGDQVLDVGSGSGWTTALLACLVGKHGHIYAVELVPELVELGQNNCLRAGIHNATFLEAGEAYGLPTDAPYDRILVSASAEAVPDDLRRQLKVGGKMIIPIHDTIYELIKFGIDDWQTRLHPGFVFVPLREPALGW